MSSCPRCHAVLPSGEGPCPACHETGAGSDRETFRESPTVTHRGAFLGVETDLDPRDDLTPLEPWTDQPSAESTQDLPQAEAGHDIASSPVEPRDDLTPIVPMDDSNPQMARLLEQAARAEAEAGEDEPEEDEPLAVGEVAPGNITEEEPSSEKPRQGLNEAPTRGWNARFDPHAVAMAAPSGGDGKPRNSPSLVATALHTPRFTPPPIRTEQIREDPTTPAGELREDPTTPAGELREDPTTPAGELREDPTTPAGELREDPTTPAGELREDPTTPAGELREDPTTPTGELREAPTDPVSPARVDVSAASVHEEEGERLEDSVAAHRPEALNEPGVLDRADGTTIPKIVLDFPVTSTLESSPSPSPIPHFGASSISSWGFWRASWFSAWLPG